MWCCPDCVSSFFADDSIIFGRANHSEIDIIKKIIQNYEGASGQMINYDKSEISFSASVDPGRANALADLLGARFVDKHGKYLGVPGTVGRYNKELFQMLEHRVRKKVKDWKRRFLSGAGKMVLIKAVAQSIPTYLMKLLSYS